MIIANGELDVSRSKSIRNRPTLSFAVVTSSGHVTW